MVLARKILSPALLPPALLAAIATWATWTDSLHHLLNGQGMFPVYADLRSVTATAECIIRDPSWTITSPTCDPFGREYNYPSFWAQSFALLRLDVSRTEEVAMLMMGLFILAFAIICFLVIGPSRRGFLLFSVSASAIAPPTWLAIERANIDLFIFVLMTFGALLWLRRRSLLSALVLAIASILKIFPVGSYLLFYQARDRHPYAPWLFLAVGIPGLLYLLPEVSSISRRTPQVPVNSFGAPLLFEGAAEALKLEWGAHAPRLLGVFLFVAIGAIFIFAESHRSRVAELMTTTVNDIAVDRVASVLILTFGGSFITAYVLGTNFDYRLVFAIPIVAGLARSSASGRSLGRGLAGAFVVQMWLTYPAPIWIEVASDLAWVALGPIFALIVFRVSCKMHSHSKEFATQP